MSKNIYTQIFLFVFAHPDDESFYSGGLISRIARAGGQAHILTLTKGERGYSNLPEKPKSEHDFGRIRNIELNSAAQILGANSVTSLEYPDGELEQQSLSDLINVILNEVRIIRPKIIVTFGEEPYYNHKDHLVTEQAVATAWSILPDTQLWKRAYHPDQLKTLHELRITKRSKTPAVRKTNWSLSNYQNATISIAMTDTENRIKQKALEQHITQKPGSFVSLLNNPAHKTEYYAQFDTPRL